MLIAHRRPALLASLLLLAPLVTACGSGLAAVGAGVAGAAMPAARSAPAETPVEQSQITGEIREVDQLQRRLMLATDDGRTGTVYYDANTVVVHRQEHIPFANLRVGDRVIIQARQERHGPLYAARIDLHQPVEDGG